MEVKCTACDGKGGVEYEPGLLSYTCGTCKGRGTVSTDPPPPTDTQRMDWLDAGNVSKATEVYFGWRDGSFREAVDAAMAKEVV